MIIQLGMFAFCIIMGVAPCVLWGMLGGDESFEKKHPKTRKALKFVHHWWIGLFIMFLGAILYSIPILGWGLGTTIDDALFHSFENYFMRKVQI